MRSGSGIFWAIVAGGLAIEAKGEWEKAALCVADRDGPL